ncbi:MAG: hypothetical protein PHH68_01630 [Candidatus Omnitrophica bacterium]|nr:hypothetical protein [Candidatus Omnitrophota bacterium]MDD5079010.1 hypothetical protein [Candidatus Omnitrophota bacterium]
MAAKKKKKAITPKKKVSKKKVLKRKPVKASRKKTAVKPKKAAAKKAVVRRPKLADNVVGRITHYFPKVRAAVIRLKAPLSLGDAVRFKGHTTDFKQNIVSMQIDHSPITQGKKGDEIGLLVNSRVRRHDVVSKV